MVGQHYYYYKQFVGIRKGASSCGAASAPRRESRAAWARRNLLHPALYLEQVLQLHEELPLGEPPPLTPVTNRVQVPVVVC